MKLPKYKILRALCQTMNEHRWQKNMKKVFIKSFVFYLENEPKRKKQK